MHNPAQLPNFSKYTLYKTLGPKINLINSHSKVLHNYFTQGKKVTLQQRQYIKSVSDKKLLENYEVFFLIKVFPPLYYHVD